MSREDAMRILNMLEEANQDEFKKFYRGHIGGSPDMLRDW
jgi:hypothetical protein